MKLSDFLSNVGRPVAFYPGLAKALGGIKPAVFVCQMAYWKDKGDDPNGWIYKTSDDIEKETALTYKEQTAVRKFLSHYKILEERYARTEHQMYFRINWDALNTAWDEHITSGKVLEHLPKSKVASSKKSGGSRPKVISLNSNTETTHKTTQQNTNSADKPRPPKAQDFPSNVLFREVTGRWPAKEVWHAVLHAVSLIEKRIGRAPVRDDIFPFLEEWSLRGNKPTNLKWLTEWAVTGSIPGRQNFQQKPTPAQKSNWIEDAFNSLLSQEEPNYGNA